MISIAFPVQESLVKFELIGLLMDFMWSGMLLLLYLPIYFILSKISYRFADYFSLGLIAIICIVHFLVLKYFLYQLIPLDVFLFQYSLEEVIYTVSTSTNSILFELILLPCILILFILLYFFLNKYKVKEKLYLPSLIIVSISIFAFVVFHFLDISHPNRFSINKSIYFFKNSILFALEGNKEDTTYTAKDVEDFQELFDGKNYISEEYPLLHSFEKRDMLSKYFHDFDTAPNIVVLVVEGLSDDFIHPYRNLSLMPFLDSLKTESLYWNKCFTLGERSFAAIPSILGSLPYGKIGFTLLDRLPRHLSLVSILHANGYYISYFYGQGSWFHKKSKFFKYNNVDLIVDNEDYPGKYEKIIVDDFFWGYNDKDLFNHSLDVLDSLPASKRLDVYFTGTTHSPFAISDVDKYDAQLSEMVKDIDGNDTGFFNSYRKYFLTLLFANDALESFFNKYKSRDGYENTIFLISGDHPMTEIPIANSLKRYHVPLLIFSPKLKQGKEFDEVVSHLDIYGSILSLLSEYDVDVPLISTAIGDHLFKNNSKRKIAFMDDNREMIDYLSGDYYLSEHQLYSVGDDLSIEPIINSEKLHELRDELTTFRRTSRYVSIHDKIISDSLYCQSLGFKLLHSKKMQDTFHFNSEYHNLLKKEMKNTTFSLEISFNYDADVMVENFTLVYQLSDKNDNTLYWENTGVTNEDGYFQLYLQIPQQNTSDSLLDFSLYFWNQKKQDFTYSDLRLTAFKQ